MLKDLLFSQYPRWGVVHGNILSLSYAHSRRYFTAQVVCSSLRKAAPLFGFNNETVCKDNAALHVSLTMLYMYRLYRSHQQRYTFGYKALPQRNTQLECRIQFSLAYFPKITCDG